MKGAHTAVVGATSSRAGRRSTIKSYKEESDNEVESSTNGKVKREESDHEPPSSDDDLPLAKKANGSKINGKVKSSPRKRVKKEESDGDASGASEVEKPKRKPAAKRIKKEVKDEADSDGATPKRTKSKKEPKEPKPKKPKKEEEEGPIYKWWNEEDPEGDGSKKWDTLKHAGVLFPPPYEPLPSNVKMLYNGL
jgi:DNA topoisomerase-1